MADPWLVGAGGAVLAFEGTRRRSAAAGALAAVGGALAWWALGGAGLPGARRRAAQLFDRLGWGNRDRVQEESAQSFPASDAPPWTPITGSGLRHRGRRR